MQSLANDRGLRYEPVGGLNPRDAPAALCPGGSNRLTGELVDGFYGAGCDAGEYESGRWMRKTVLPGALLAKAHMPDLAKVISAFNVESIEARPGEILRKRASLGRVQLESVEFNRRYLATVPKDYDATALRELFSPGFIDWLIQTDAEMDFGISDRQLWFTQRLRSLDRAGLEDALSGAAELFRRLRKEMDESGLATYPAGPWHAGLEEFPG